MNRPQLAEKMDLPEGFRGEGWFRHRLAVRSRDACRDPKTADRRLPSAPPAADLAALTTV
jgi:hypothetical protein